MATNTYVALDKVTVGTATPSITFTGISGAYTDLVVVVSAKSSLTTTTQNALSVSAYIPVVGATAKIADIVKQEASHRYLVKTGDGMGQCKLTATDTLVSGEMNLIATDSLGSTYWVTKLTARRCVLTRRTNGGSGYEFNTNNSAGWTLNAPSIGVVSVANF
jgi:hypothetical protein